MLIPVGIVHATITGTPVLGVANHDDSPPGSVVPSAFTAAVSNVKVIAGTDHVAPTATGCDGAACAYSPAYFAIDFNGVTFSGASFYLYISQNGLANVNTTAGDIRYAGAFAVSDLAGAGAYQVQGIGGGITGASYWIGTAGGFKLIVGPVPVQISTSYKYIKVYDGSCGANPTFCGGTGIAGAVQQSLIQPGIVINPTSGPAWSPVHVSGGGFTANQMVNINYTFTFFSWATGTPSLKTGAITSGVSTGPGFFGPVLMSIIDTKQALNAFGGPYPMTPITVTAVNASSHNTVLNSAQNAAFPVIFNEFPRQFNQIVSYFSGAAVSNSGYVADTDGNSSAGHGGVAPYLPTQPVQVYVTGSLGIVGSNFTVGGTVTIWVGTINTGTFTADANGHFVANVTVPKLPVGPNTVTAQANGVNYILYINVNPTLILTPNTGPVGTVVTATAYGFPANSWVSLWWFESVFETGTDSLLLNSTIDNTGSYNHTITFAVPASYGGAHDVSATKDNWGSPVSDASLEAGVGFVTEATFTVTGVLSISNSTFADNGGLVTVTGTGFVPGEQDIGCAFSCKYYVNIDNAWSDQAGQGPNRGGVAANHSGFLSVTFVAAGFRPGLHVFALIGPAPPCLAESNCDTVNPAAPNAFILFTVTTTGDPIADQLTALTTSVNGLTTSLTSIQTSLSAIQSDVSSLSSSFTSFSTSATTSLSGITTSLSGITTSLSGITSSVGNIQSSLTAITSDVSGLGGQLTSLQSSATAIQNAATSLTTSVGNLGTQLTGIQNSLTSMGSQLSSIATDAHTAAQQSSAAATSAANAVNGNATAQTYVLVVAVLAAITLVLELAILVRKLS